MDEQCLSRDHRAAIALNNMGVSLLERRAYRQGMETLKDAIFVMKCVLRPRSIISSQGLGEMPSSISYAEEKVHRASKRMANPQPIPSAMCIDVVSRCATFSHYPHHSDSVLRMSSSSPLRIEATDHISLEDRDSDLESSIMLYNFGLAHLCMAKLVKTPIKLQEGALTLFKMAYCVLAPLYDQEGHGSREDIVILAASTLNNTITLLSKMGKQSEANESDQELARLERAIQEFQDGNLEDQITAAAAAA
jgi:exonuclease VII small subunit